MSGRQPLTLLTREVRPLRLTRSNSCLLLHDVHAPFTDRTEGWLGRHAAAKVLLREFDEYFDALDLMLPNFARVLDACRKLGLPVAYTCLGYRPPEAPSLFQTATGWTWNLNGRDGSFPVELQPGPGDAVFSKPGWGAPANHAFVGFLADRVITEVIMVGTFFDFGIQHSCYALGELGIGSLVVSDAAPALIKEGQGYTAHNIAHGLTKLRNTAELLDLLELLRQEGSVLI